MSYNLTLWTVNRFTLLSFSALITFPYISETEAGIFRQILDGKIDFESEPWPSISESAKDLMLKMLERDPRKRVTAHEVLCE